jgi:hypothetical protein
MYFFAVRLCFLDYVFSYYLFIFMFLLSLFSFFFISLLLVFLSLLLSISQHFPFPVSVLSGTYHYATSAFCDERRLMLNVNRTFRQTLVSIFRVDVCWLDAFGSH